MEACKHTIVNSWERVRVRGSKLFFTKTLKITTPTLTLIGHMESNFRVNGKYLMHVMVRAVRCCRLVLGVSVRLGVR